MRIEENVPLARFTTLGTGGPARAFARPESLDELHEALAWARERDLPVATVGLGSNLLVADDGVHGGSDAAGQLAHFAHFARGHPRQPVTADDVHHHQLRAGLRRDAGCSAHQGLRFRPTCDGDDDTFARLPGVGDLVLFTVLLKGRVDLVGEPEQRQFA